MSDMTVIHQQGWEELIRAFSGPYRKSLFDPLEADPSIVHYVVLASALESYDITIRDLTDADISSEEPLHMEGSEVGGMCFGSNEVALAKPSYSMLAHEGAHALDHRIPGYEWGKIAECIAVSVEHLLCFDLIEDWQPDVAYGRHWGVTKRLIDEQRTRIEAIYTLISSSLYRTRNLLCGYAV